MITIPNTLYKYRCFNKYGLDILENERLFLSSPKNLNDPLDCKIPVRYDLGSQQQIYETNISFYQHVFPNLSLEEIERLSNIQTRSIISNLDDKNRKEKFARIQDKMINERFGIFSLSCTAKSTLLWGHYADGHRGFCIGFDSEAFINLFNLKFQKENIVYWLDRVRYMPEIPVLNPYEDGTKVYLEQIFAKSVAWGYEQEVRLVVANKPDELLNITPSLISCVILGARISDENTTILQNILEKKTKRIPLLKAEFYNNSFEAEFKEVLYD